MKRRSANGSDGNTTRLLTIKDAAQLLGVSASTLRNWDKQGKLRPRRHPMNRYRLYSEAELKRIFSGFISRVTV